MKEEEEEDGTGGKCGKGRRVENMKKSRNKRGREAGGKEERNVENTKEEKESEGERWRIT